MAAFSQTVYFVNQSTGSDTNNGISTSTPFKTIDEVCNNVSPGDTVKIMGEYVNTSYNASYSFFGDIDDAHLWHAENTIKINGLNGSAAGGYITFKSYDSNTILKGDGANILRVQNCSYLRFENLGIKGEVGNIPLSTAKALQFVYKDGGAAQYQVTPGTTDEEIELTTFPVLGSVSRPSYVDTRGFYLSGVHHIDVTNCHIHHMPGGGLRFTECNFINVIENEIDNNSRRSYSGTHGFVVSKADSRMGGDETGTGYKIRIERNKVHHNYNEMYSWSPAKDIITPRIDEGKGISLQRNRDLASENEYWINGRFLVANNLCYWNGFSGVHSNDGDRMDFVNNISYMNSYSNTVTYADDPAGNNIGISTAGGTDIKIINNISVVDASWGGYAIAMSENVTPFEVRNNIVYGVKGTLSHDPDVAAVEVNTTETDPLFIDTKIFDFNLQENSPAIGAANTIYAPSDDYYETTRDASPDIGAIEYVEPTITNLVCNGDFESGYTTDWSNNINGGAVAFSDETTEVYEGTTSLKAVVTTADTWRNRVESCNLSLSLDHTYKLSFWAKTASGNPADVKIKINGPNYVDVVSVANSIWAKYTYEFSADADYSGTGYVRISFMDVETYYIDDVILEDVSTYDCNGDLNGLAYIDNCDECVGGNTGVTSSCTETKLGGIVKALDDNYFGLNTKNIGDANIRKDINFLEAWKATNAKIYRYPGGTFGNSFDWHTGTTIVGGRPPEVDPPVTPTDLVKYLPDDTDILWMANVRVPTPATGYDWRTLTRTELLSNAVLQAKVQDILDGLAVFETAGKPVKYLELGNEFYFSDDEGLNETHGAGGDGGDYQGDHFPYDDNSSVYIQQMGEIAEAVKAEYPDIKISVIRWKAEVNGADDWNTPINDAFTNNTKVANYIDAVTNHWYQNEVWYDNQSAAQPAITDAASTKTAFGFAFDYIDFKWENDIAEVPSGKELWITEGDLHDPSTNGTWVDGIREGIIQLNYVLMDHVTMNTPHMFQPNYVSSTSPVTLTAKGEVASIIYAAGYGKDNVLELDLDGAYFNGDFGGPYSELQAVKFQGGSQDERLVVINCSGNTYSNMDFSGLITAENLNCLTRYNTTPWGSDTHTETTGSFDKSSVTLQPYSITIFAEQYVLDLLVLGVDTKEYVVCDPSSAYPTNYINLYDFGRSINSGETQDANLNILNNGAGTLTLAVTPLSLYDGTHFTITQPVSNTITASATEGITVTFAPQEEGDFIDTLLVTDNAGTVLKVALKGTANIVPINLFSNGNFEDGIHEGWELNFVSDAGALYTAADAADTHNGSISGKVEVIQLDTPGYGDVTLETDSIAIPAGLSSLNLSMYAKCTGGSGDFKFSPAFYDATGTQLSVENYGKTLTTSYAEYTQTSVPVPANTVNCIFTLKFGNIQDTYFYDDLVVEVTNSNVPVITSSAIASVDENNATVLSVTATDSDSWDELSYAISGGADADVFNISTTTGTLSFIEFPDYEIPSDANTDNDYVVEVKVSDLAGNSAIQTITITVNNVVEPMFVNGDFEKGINVDWTMSNAGDVTVTYSAADVVDTYAGSVSAKLDVTALGSPAYNDAKLGTSVIGIETGLTTIDMSVYAKSASNGNDFKFVTKFYDANSTLLSTDYSEANNLTNSFTQYSRSIAIPANAVTFEVEFRCGSAVDAYFFDNFEIADPAGVNAPVITSANTVTVDEEQTTILTVVAMDADAGDTQTYSISGGTDQAKFSINASTGELTFATAPDYETPTDADYNNDYVVEVTVTDGSSLTDVQTITVTVADITEVVNMLCNGDFESGYNIDWTLNTNGDFVTYSEETTDVYSGSKALKAVVSTADSWANRIESCTTPLETNHSYKLTFWAKTVSGSSAQVKLKISGPNIVEVIDITSGTWTKYTYYFTADADYPTGYIRLSFMEVEGYIIDKVILDDTSVLDCNGDYNGGAYNDYCGVCVGGNTGLEPTCESPNYFRDEWVAKTYSTPATTTSNALTTGTPDVTISINTTNELAKVLPTHFGSNTPFRNGNDQLTRTGLYTNSGHGCMRFPAGSGSNEYYWDGNIPATLSDVTLSDGTVEQPRTIDGTQSSAMSPELFTQFINGAGSEATIVVNYFYARYGVTAEGTREARVQQAADYAASFVNYMNNTLGANIKNWEIGNEIYGAWETGYNVGGSIVTGQEYGEDFRVFSEAMKAVDPTIKVGVVVKDVDDAWNMQVLPEVQNHADFLAVHNYFLTVSESTPANVLASVGQIGDIKNTLHNCVAKYTSKPADYFPIAMTEYNSRGEYNVTMMNGLFITQILGELIKNEYGMSTIWVSEWNLDATTGESKGILARNDPDQADYTPRQSYIPFQYYNRCFGDKMVEVSSTDADVKVYASTFTSGEIGLVVVNSTGTDKTVQLDLSSVPNGGNYNAAYWYDFYATDMNSGNKKFYINGQTGVTAGGGPSDFETLAPYESSYTTANLFSSKKYSIQFIVLQSTNVAPVITSATTANASENQTAVLTVTATDANDGDTQTYSISGGADQAKFSIDATTGVLTFASALDYETPTDADSNNDYVVEVTVTDGGGLTAVQTITVSVTDVVEGGGSFSNWDFESGFDTEWTFNVFNAGAGTYTQALAGDTYAGSVSGQVEVTVAGAHGDVRLKTDLITLPVGEDKVGVSVYAKSLAGKTSELRLAIDFYDTSDALIGTGAFVTNSLSTEYTIHKGEFAVPTNAVSAIVSLRCGTAVDTYYFDDLKMYVPAYNPDFELGTSVGWDISSGSGQFMTMADAAPGDVYTGSFSAKVYVESSLGSYASAKLNMDTIVIEAGKTKIDLSLYAKASSATVDAIKLCLVYLDDQGNDILLPDYTGTKDLTTSYQQFTLSASIPGGAVKCIPHLRMGAVAGTYFIDDFEVSFSLSPYTWTGGVSSDWNTAENWSGGVVPTAGDKVSIVSGTHDVQISGAVDVNELHVLSGQMTILPNSQITVSNDLSTNNSLTIQNSYSQPTSFITNGSVFGDVNYTYSYDANRYWYIGHAISNPDIASYDAIIPGGASYVLYNYPATTWNDVTGTHVFTDPLEGFAFKVDNPVTITHTGTLNNEASYSTTLGAKWHLIANPYPSYIDLSNTSEWNFGDALSTVWTTTTLTGNERGYATYNISTGVGVNEGVRYIPPGQSFWIRSYTASSTFTINSGARVHTTGVQLKALGTMVNNDVLRFEINNGETTDEGAIVFRSIGSTSVSVNDSEKRLVSGSKVANVYSLKSSDKLAISVFPEVVHVSEVPLGYTVGADGGDVAKLTFTNINDFQPDVSVCLMDKETGDMIDLRQQSEYEFSFIQGQNDTRFEVVLKPIAANVNKLWATQSDLVKVYANYENGSLQVFENLLAEGEQGLVSVYVSEVSGAKLKQESYKQSGKHNIDVTLNKGLYIIAVTSPSKGVHCYKLIVD
jgi:hypothetical protein